LQKIKMQAYDSLYCEKDRPTAGLSFFAVRRPRTPCEKAPLSRRASTPDFWPRHPRLFIRRLLRKRVNQTT
jgi:hypothetical protein